MMQQYACTAHDSSVAHPARRPLCGMRSSSALSPQRTQFFFLYRSLAPGDENGEVTEACGCSERRWWIAQVACFLYIACAPLQPGGSAETEQNLSQKEHDQRYSMLRRKKNIRTQP